MYAMGRRRAAPIAGLLPGLFGLLLGAGLPGCAPRQRVPLSCVPRSVTVYVDRDALEATPSELDLRADRPHTLFFKGGGYEPEMVVLNTVETPDGPRLVPEDVCLELDFVEVHKQLELEVDEP